MKPLKPESTDSQTPLVSEAAEHSLNNRTDLVKGSQAACYYCRATFDAEEVSEFSDGGQTGLCPRCGIDAVLSDAAGYPFDYSTLKELRTFWFGWMEHMV